MEYRESCACFWIAARTAVQRPCRLPGFIFSSTLVVLAMQIVLDVTVTSLKIRGVCDHCYVPLTGRLDWLNCGIAWVH